MPLILFIIPLELCKGFEKIKKNYLVASNGDFLCAMSVHMKIPIFRDDDYDVIKDFVTMATVAVVNKKLRLSKYHAKFQIERIYCSRDIG